MRALIVATVPSFIGQFNIKNIQILQNMGYQVEVACNWNNNGTFDDQHTENLRKQLLELGVSVHQVDFSRTPYSIKVMVAYKQLENIITQNSYKLIHCHTPVAGIITRLAARNSRNSGTKVIYTAHGFHFYKGAPWKYWMLFYPVEKLCSKYTDVLITINQEDYRRAKANMYAKSTYYIPGVGIEVKNYQIQSNKEFIYKQLGLKTTDKLVFSMGELSVRKNHERVIEAISMLNDPSIHYAIAGLGDREEEIKQLAHKLNVNLHLLGYRDDKGNLMKASDVFVFPSLQEGLPVSLLEAMAAGCPCVVSHIRGNEDLIRHNVNGFSVHNQSVNEYASYIGTLLSNKETSERLSEQSVIDVKKYDVKIVSENMKIIYQP